MDIVENHRIKLLNAKCEVVCQAEYLMKKLQNGDAIECCTKKLFAAIKLINRLDCYCFPEAAQDIKGTETLTVINDFKFSGTFYLESLVDLEYQYSYVTAGAANLQDIIEGLLIESGLEYTVSIVGPNSVFTVKTDCGKNELRVGQFFGEYSNFTVVSEPFCSDAVTCNNCSTDAELSKYYQVLDSLLK